MAGYAFENKGKIIDWNGLPKKLKEKFDNSKRFLYKEEWEVPFHVLELVDDEKNFESLSKYLVEQGYVSEKKMKKFLEDKYGYFPGTEREELEVLFVSSEED